jgi:hypothetical protein
MTPVEGASTCEYSSRCHFFNITEKNDHSSHVRELYCVNWPQQCQIFQTRKRGAPVPITLWPGGRR